MVSYFETVPYHPLYGLRTAGKNGIDNTEKLYYYIKNGEHKFGKN